MTTQLQLRRGTTAQNRVFTGAQGELTYDTELKQLRVHDGILNEQTGIMEGTQGGVVIDNNTTVVHKSDTETITGAKTFTNTITCLSTNNQWPNALLSKNDLISNNYTNPQNDVSVVLAGLVANNSDFCGYIASGKTSSGKTHTGLYVRNRADSSGTNRNGYLAIEIDSNGNAYTVSPVPAASASFSETKIATVGWVNDPTKSTNVVHRTGNETIDGVKTFNQGIVGTVNRSLWADLAEQYLSDKKYPIGTLIKFGGEKDITIADNNCNGVISEKPGLLLDYGLEDSLPIALVGKTKVRVLGKVNKFDRIVLDTEHPGLGKVQVTSDEKVIAIALESSDVVEEKLVMSVVKVNLD